MGRKKPNVPRAGVIGRKNSEKTQKKLRERKV